MIDKNFIFNSNNNIHTFCKIAIGTNLYKKTKNSENENVFQLEQKKKRKNIYETYKNNGLYGLISFQVIVITSSIVFNIICITY